MNETILHFLGLAHKAGSLCIGEEPVGAAARSRHARLILLAGDAAANTKRRAQHFAEAGQCLCTDLPFDKDDLGRALGRTSCAVLALTDVGFADALLKKLCAIDEAKYGELSERMTVKAQRAAERRKEAAQHEKNVRKGRVRKTVAEAPEPDEAKKRRREDAPPHQEHGARAKRPYRSRERTRSHSDPRQRFAHSRPVKKGKGSPKKKEQ